MPARAYCLNAATTRKHFLNEPTCTGRLPPLLCTAACSATYCFRLSSSPSLSAPPSFSSSFSPLGWCDNPKTQTSSHTTLSQNTTARPRPSAKMRGNTRQRPASHHGPPQQYVQSPTTAGAMLPARKIFNCIVDDTALVAGVKRSTRNGIRQWVKNGQIRLFVPLHGT